MISKISKRGSAHDSNEDFMIIKETDSHIRGILCDGCSTGISSKFASELTCRTFAVSMDRKQFLEDNDIEFHFIKVQYLLRSLELPMEHGFTTAILFEYDKETKILKTRFFGDGCIDVNGEFKEIDQDNIPDYFIYHKDYTDYLLKYPVVVYEDVEFFTISTDGLISFSRNQFDITEESHNPVEWLVVPVLASNMLERRYNILARNGWKHSDDLTLISYANTEQSEQS